MRLEGRKTVVVGGAGGIGGAIASVFAREGADVALVDARPADEAAENVRAHGRQALPLIADVTSRAEVSAAVAATLVQFRRIDVLVNAAGVVSFGSAAALDEAEWDRVLDINLKGVMLACQAVIPAMCEARYGRIVNIGSLLGKNGGNARPWIDANEQTNSGNIAYGVSKAGVHALTLYLARELAAHGVCVNAVAPGPIASAMTKNFPERLKAAIPLGRMGTAQEVAETVLFLASDAASFITGEIIDVNGGAWGD
ncbi:MAG: SDR family NAD(P)-dependent oxidoreductase [Burkholderiales bacterium]